jgi:hypothetical protein
MDTIADVVAAGRDREGSALTAAGRGAPYGYGEFSTNVWRAGNLLRHYGVRPGAGMTVVVGPKEPTEGEEPGRVGQAADPLLAILGGAMLGATVDLTPETPISGRAVVMPSAWLDRYEVQPGCSRLAYGEQPADPNVAHWETQVWSENPIEPPDAVEADDQFLRVGGTTHTQGELLAAARAVAEEQELESGDAVAVESPLTDVGTFVAGVLAPLSVGATILSGDPERPVTYVVRGGQEDEMVVDPATVL